MKEYRTFRDQIADVLGEKGWLWADLAEAMGVTPGRASHIRSKDDSLVPVSMIERVAEALEVDPMVFDCYVAKQLPQLAMRAPGLLDIARMLLKAKDRVQLARVAEKIRVA